MNNTQNTILDIMTNCSTNIEHAKQVAEYCEKIIAALNGKILNFTEQEKNYLKTAALLHDIGYCIEKKSHHKHTMSIILKKGLAGFSEEETKIIANIARYHRSSLPDETKHEEYAKLTSEQKNTVKKLAAILRIADGMDKPHKNLIIKISAEQTEENINFQIKTIGFKPKLKSAKEKSDLFELITGKTTNYII